VPGQNFALFWFKHNAAGLSLCLKIQRLEINNKLYIFYPFFWPGCLEQTSRGGKKRQIWMNFEIPSE
jgi:hypothetical protein